MKIILTITICFIHVFSLLAQNAYEELNGLAAGSSGWQALTKGNYDESILDSRRSLQFDSSQSYVHFNIALAYLLKGENETSLIEYENAIKQAERYGIPKENFQGAINDLVNYKNIIPKKQVADSAIHLIKKALNSYSNTTTMFLHVPRKEYSDSSNIDFAFTDRMDLDGFKITTSDVSGNMIWTSDKIKEFVVDSLEYLIKVEIPQSVLLKSKKTDCQYFYSTLIKKPGSLQSLETEYFSENRTTKFSYIQLNLKSTPIGAEIFLIPNSVWMKDFEGKNWQSFSESIMDKFYVNGTKTNTSTHIDETVFVILFKLNGNYKLKTYFTKPAQLEPVQTVSITF